MIMLDYGLFFFICRDLYEAIYMIILNSDMTKTILGGVQSGLQLQLR